MTGGRTILNELSFTVDRGETLILLGRSGSGKTTAIRLINRLLNPSSGHIRVDGQDVMETDPIALRRRIGYVIQEFGLLPHWTVERNVTLVPELLRWPPEQRRARAKEVLAQVGLPYDLVSQRKPALLSGGQRQRVGVARALAASPGLLLFDEPFGALDPVTRRDLQEQFVSIREQYQVASVFVTHDLAEAMTIGTKIAVLDEGKLEAMASPSEFLHLETPVASAFVRTLTPKP